MIVGERKPFDEIKDKIRDYKKVLIHGTVVLKSILNLLKTSPKLVFVIQQR